MKRFADHRLIRDLAVHYAAVEYHVGHQEATIPFAPPSIPRAIERLITQYAERFAEETVRGGRGLYLTGPDRVLSAVSQFVAQLFDSMKVSVCRIRADRKPSASEMRDALAAPLFIVERIDFLTEDVAELICKRADLVRPTIVTSTLGPETVSEPYLRRVLASSMRLIVIEASADIQESVPTQEHAAT